MFLDALVERNPDLVRAAVELHQGGELPPATYVIDIDTLFENAVILFEEARRLGLSVLPMTKQFGRNPVAIQALERAGAKSFVAVDMGCAEAIDRAGAHVGHLGHLVQVPKHEAARAAAMRPDFWTVFDVNKAEQAGAAAAALDQTQDILARIFGPGDLMFESHAGGFDADEIEKVASQLSAIPGCRFAGVSTYPALAFNRETRQVEATPNLHTVAAAVEKLEALGYEHMEVNAPGVTSTVVLPMLAEGGATQVEPGHGFTGTTPLHAVADLPERPAIAFVTEVSHLSGESAFSFGGGLYQCIDTIPGRVPEALVGSDPEGALKHRATAHFTDYQVIDFYGRLTPTEGTVIHPGDSVVYCFRPQVFYTRAYVAPVSGISSGKPQVEGIFDSQGRPVR